ncbi:hypothetical protein VHEMI10702 [[Torrubiella] hemipterigena]|uniref:C2H2-type domain-containing protein n=1 Tax=[Torrubiella] hemipterigena TaxID=1531966 RepID=A0A0A1TTN2_9HYPO|nr:hypothetical protein VHEMI10702 [[Torrubiella] hemipterigena]
MTTGALRRGLNPAFSTDLHHIDGPPVSAGRHLHDPSLYKLAPLHNYLTRDSMPNKFRHSIANSDPARHSVNQTMELPGPDKHTCALAGQIIPYFSKIQPPLECTSHRDGNAHGSLPRPTLVDVAAYKPATQNLMSSARDRTKPQDDPVLNISPQLPLHCRSILNYPQTPSTPNLRCATSGKLSSSPLELVDLGRNSEPVPIAHYSLNHKAGSHNSRWNELHIHRVDDATRQQHTVVAPCTTLLTIRQSDRKHFHPVVVPEATVRSTPFLPDSGSATDVASDHRHSILHPSPSHTIQRSGRTADLHLKEGLAGERYARGRSLFNGTRYQQQRPLNVDRSVKTSRVADSGSKLRVHGLMKRHKCAYCDKDFNNKNEANRHQISAHLRPCWWSCSALADDFHAFHDSITRPGEADVCSYCGIEFNRSGNFFGKINRYATVADWEGRSKHLRDVHKLGKCNPSKKFYRLDHFRQHLKHSHAAVSGIWTTDLEARCLTKNNLQMD